MSLEGIRFAIDGEHVDYIDKRRQGRYGEDAPLDCEPNPACRILW